MAGHPETGRQSLQRCDALSVEMLGDPINPRSVALHRSMEPGLEFFPVPGYRETRTVRRSLRFSYEVMISLHITELVPQLEGERAMLVKDEIEVEGHIA